MKKSIFLIICYFFTLSIAAQEWITSFEEAKTMASKSNQNIVLVFQGSDWCGPCIKLDKEIWSTSEFQELAKNHFVMLQADFPRRKQNKLSPELQEHNNALAEKYNPNGYFPFVVVLSSNGDILGTRGYEKTTPELFFNSLKNFEK